MRFGKTVLATTVAGLGIAAATIMSSVPAFASTTSNSPAHCYSQTSNNYGSDKGDCGGSGPGGSCYGQWGDIDQYVHNCPPNQPPGHNCYSQMQYCGHQPPPGSNCGYPWNANNNQGNNGNCCDRYQPYKTSLHCPTPPVAHYVPLPASPHVKYPPKGQENEYVQWGGWWYQVSFTTDQGGQTTGEFVDVRHVVHQCQFIRVGDSWVWVTIGG